MLKDTTAKSNIEARFTDRGIEIYAFNKERATMLHVGTIHNAVYTKGNVSVLRNPQPSICLSTEEFEAVKDAGAQMFRAYTRDKEIYAVEIALFDRHKIPFTNPAYGSQYRLPLTEFMREPI